MNLSENFFLETDSIVKNIMWPPSSAGIGNTLLSLTVVFIAPIARVAEAVTTQIRALDYIEAARASGAGALTVIRVHVLRVVLGPIFIYASSLISVSIILASGLSFLGFGVKPPEPKGA